MSKERRRISRCSRDSLRSAFFLASIHRQPRAKIVPRSTTAGRMPNLVDDAPMLCANITRFGTPFFGPALALKARLLLVQTHLRAIDASEQDPVAAAEIARSAYANYVEDIDMTARRIRLRTLSAVEESRLAEQDRNNFAAITGTLLYLGSAKLDLPPPAQANLAQLPYQFIDAQNASWRVALANLQQKWLDSIQAPRSTVDDGVRFPLLRIGRTAHGSAGAHEIPLQNVVRITARNKMGLLSLFSGTIALLQSDLRHRRASVRQELHDGAAQSEGPKAECLGVWQSINGLPHSATISLCITRSPVFMWIWSNSRSGRGRFCTTSETAFTAIRKSTCFIWPLRVLILIVGWQGHELASFDRRQCRTCRPSNQLQSSDCWECTVRGD